MRNILLLPLLFLSLQTQAADVSQPATSNIPGAQYPRIYADARVEFRLEAPEAQKVQLKPGGDGLGKSAIDMQKGEAGTWTVTTPPAVAGFHYYWFIVDGVAVNDPNSEAYFGWGKQTSGVEIPEKGVDFYDAKDVPHGQIRILPYHSKITGSTRRAYVYTPPSYDNATDKRFPVLYLQHGAGEDERSWTTQGKMNFIMDNLLAANKAKPMIVVMDKGYATKPGAPLEPAANGRPAAPKNVFGDVVIEELIPLIDSTFRTLTDRDHRAMAGLSMGSGQALQITLTHLDKFSYIGSFSGPARNFNIDTSYNGVFKDATTFNAKAHLLWIGAGTAEEQIHTAAKTMQESLDKADIKNIFVEIPGTAHEWQTWRKSFYDFAPRLFQE